MIKLVPNLLKRMFTPMLIKSIPKYFCAQFTIDPYVEHYAELTMRQHRRLHLNRSVLNQNKDVVYAQLRKPEDSIISLKQQGKCPGVIQTISGKIQDQIDIVVDGKKMRKLSKTDMFPLNQVYVRVAGKQYRCVFYKKDFHSDGFLEKVYLKQYVPGQPNHLTVPIQVTHITQNPYVMRNGQADVILEDLDIICYNEEYPTRFYVDISYCLPDRPYRVGDLVNTFPPGIIISPKHTLNDRIVGVIEQIFISEVEKEEMIKQKLQKSKVKSDKPAAGTPAAGTTPGATGGDAGKDKAATGTAGGAKTGGGEKDAGGKKK